MPNNFTYPEILANGDTPNAVRWMDNYYFVNDKHWQGTAFPTGTDLKGAGQLCYRTDVPGMYVYNGSTWDKFDISTGGVTWQNVKIVAKSGGTYTSIATAIAACTTPSDTNRYTIFAMAGDYDESVDCAEYVDIIALSKATRIVRTGASQYCLKAKSNCQIIGLELKSTGASGEGIRLPDEEVINLYMERIKVTETDYPIKETATAARTRTINLKTFETDETIAFTANSYIVNSFFDGLKIAFTGNTTNQEGLRLYDFSDLRLNNTYISVAFVNAGETSCIKIVTGTGTLINSAGYFVCGNSGAGNAVGLNVIGGNFYDFGSYIYASASGGGTSYDLKQSGSSSLNIYGTKYRNANITGAINFYGNEFKIGDGTDADIYLYFNNADANKPGVRYNKTTNKIEQSRDGSTWSALFLEAEIDHANILNKGTNAHSAIDSHIASTSNPHSVTKAQIGLTNVTDDAQLKRAAADWTGYTEKTTLVDDDLFLIEDSADSGTKKKVKKSNIGGGGGGNLNREIIYWPAGAMEPAANFGDIRKDDGTNNTKYRGDVAVNEYFEFEGIVDEQYDAGQITVEIWWKAAATTGNVRFEAGLVSQAEAESDDQAYITTNGTFADDAAQGTTLYLSKVTLALTPTAAQMTAGEIMKVRIKRVAAGSSEMSGDAMVRFAKIKYTAV